MNNIKKMTAVLLGLFSFMLATSQGYAATVLNSTSCTDASVMTALSARETAFAAKDITTLGSMIDTNFLKAAQNKTALLTQWTSLFASATSVQETLSSVSCAPNATAGLEDVLTFQTITKTVSGVTSSQMSLQHFVLKSGAGGWTFYGNQKNFEFQFGTVSHINPTTGSSWAGLNLFVDDPANLVASATISGPGISGTANLFSFSKPNGNGTTGTGWKNYNQTTNVNIFPAVMPALPATYTLTVTEKSGPVTTKTLNYTAFNTNYPTALIPNGNYTATTPPTFSWTAPATGQYAYGLQVNTMPTVAGATTMVWNPNNSFPGTSLLYAGPTLASGGCYSYNVTATDIYQNIAQTEGYLGMNTAACLPVPVNGTGTHTASGTYTWDSGTSTLTLNTTTSDFTCEGPSLGTRTDTGVTITATTMTWPGKTDTWTRSSGTVGSIVGTWTLTNSATGNSFALTFNANGTISVTGVIVSCSGSGGSWAAMTPMLSAHGSTVGGVINGKFYVVGGWSGASTTTAVEMYDPVTNIWTTKAPALTGRTIASGGVINGKLYVVGGCAMNSDCRIGATNVLEAYDPVTDSWTNLAAMPTTRFGAATGVINGRLYVAGGSGACPPCGALTVVESYDPVANTWRTEPALPSGVEGAQGAVINGVLYVVGGYTWTTSSYLNSVYAFDPLTSLWTAKATMPTARDMHNVETVNGILYAFGGLTNTTTTAAVEAYDPVANLWTAKTSMPTTRVNMGTGVLNGRIYIAGGSIIYGGTTLSTVDVYQPSGSGTGTHTASGTYTWDSTTGVATWHWTASDFVGCDGPSLGATKTNTGVVITATAMTWANDNMTWTRSSGTAGNIVGTWTSTDPMTGNSYTVTVNTGGTVSVSANIVVVNNNCGGGNPNLTANAMSQHWSNSYNIQLQYNDSPKTATAVSVSGPGITGSMALTYDTNSGSWASWASSSTNNIFWATLPTGLPYTYTFNITPATGTPTTATSTVSCFQQLFATNLSPTGSVTGTGNPTFSWTGIADTSTTYQVQLNDSNNNQVWQSNNISGASIVYNGPALTPGMAYNYNVVVNNSAACSSGASFAQGSFTYGNGGGGQNPSASSRHWSDGYYVHFQYYDSPQTASSVSVTGPGITGSLSLTYEANHSSWNSLGSNFFIGTTSPTGLPYTYTFDITPATGTPTTATSTVSCFQPLFATNLSPTGSVTGTGNPTFSWTGISDTSATYSVELRDNNIFYWNSGNISGTSVVYNGPALTPGTTYTYYVEVNNSAACNSGASFAQGSFTYGSGTAVGYAGTYSGTYSGSDMGTWTATVSSSGAVTVTVNSNILGSSIGGSGQVSSNGGLTMTTTGSVSNVATFTGTINSTTGAVSGTWTGFISLSGSFSGTVTPVTTITVTSDATTLAAPVGMAGIPSSLDLARLDTADMTGLTFQSAAVGAFGTGTPVPPGAPTGTQVINIPPGDGQNGYFKTTFTLPATFTGIQLSGAANMDDVGRVFLNGNPLTPTIQTTTSGQITEFGNATFSTTNAAFFMAGINELIFSDANTGAGPSGAAFYATITYNTSVGADTQAPSVPTGLAATPTSASQVNLSWAASTDNVGVTGYKVYRNGTLVGSPSGTSYSDTGLTASTSYSYTVAACDAAGNCSASSAVASAAASFSIASGWAGVVVASGGTNFLVALESDTTTAKVAAQLMSLAGAKIGSPIPLGHDGQSCCASGAAFDGTNYLMTWEEDQGIKNSPAPFLVYGQFMNTSGAAVGQAFAMTSAGISLDGLNMLAYGGGKYLLTYTRLIVPANGANSTNRYVAGRIISPDGTMGNEFRISTGYGNGSSVTFNGANGENFFVVWKEDSNDYEVRGRFVSPAGVPLGEISINASHAPSDNPVAVAFDGTNYMVVFNDEVGATPTSPTHAWDVLGQRVSVNDGSLVGGVITISNDPGAQVAMSVAFDGSNHLVAWVDMTNDANGNGICDTGEGTCWDVYGQYVGKDGALVGSKFAINTGAGNQMGGIGCGGGKCMALVSSGIVMGQGGPSQVGEVYGAFLTSTPALSDTQAPTVPTGLAATPTSASQVNLSWAASTDNVGVTGYKVYRNSVLVGSPAGTSYSDTGLTASTGYSYTVAACDAAANCSVQTAAVSATTLAIADTVAPSVPTGLAATPTSSSQVNLSWTVSTDNVGVTGYKVYRNSVLIASPSGTSYSNTGLTAATGYSYTVAACDAAGNCSTPSTVASATTLAIADTVAPSVPAGLAATPTSSSQVNLSWTASTDNVGVTSYQVFRNNGQVGWTASTVTSFSDTGSTGGIAASTTYSYTVAACDAAGNCSAPSAVASATTLAIADTVAPSVPAGLAATPASSSQVNLSWTVSTDNVGVTGYKVYRNSVLVGSPAGTGYSDTGLTASTGYSYTVAACDAAANCSVQSAAVSATTNAGAVTLNFVSSWNLVGNSANAQLYVATTLGDATKVQTVWKWISATSKWAFYTPTLADGGAAYAATKGYDFLTTINGGEGFWVNAKAGFTASLPAGTTVTTASFQDQLTPPNPLPAGWSLISVGDNPTPLVFNNRIGQTPPATGAIATNLTTLWAWDSATTSWYFYAPSLDAAGTLASYIIGKNYLNFFAPIVKVLDPTMGFWVNRPASAGAPSTTAVAISSIQTQMTAFQNLFATAKPAATDPALAAFFDVSFLDNGMDKAAFLTMLVDPNNGLNAGDQFVGVAAAAPLDAGAVANDATHQWFTFAIQSAGGYASHDNGGGAWLAIKDAVTGNWLIAGNRRHVGVSVMAQASQQIPSAAQIATGATTTFNSEVNLDVHTGTGGGGAAAIAAAGVTSVLVTGPGIVPANGVTIYSSGQHNWAPPCGSQGPTGTITTDCMDVSLATAGARYTFRIFTTAGGATAPAYTYTEALYAAPVPVAGLTAANFPAITSVTPTTFASGATVTVNWTLPAGLRADWIGINGWTNIAPYGQLFQTGSSLSGAALTKPLVVPAYTGTLGGANIYLQARDVNGMSYVTSKQY